MSRRQHQKSKRIKWLVWGVVAVVVIAIGVKFYLGYRELKQMDHKIASLKQDIDQLKQKKKNLKAEIKRVNSPEFIEHAAREKLGLIKEGEILYITVEEK